MGSVHRKNWHLHREPVVYGTARPPQTLALRSKGADPQAAASIIRAAAQSYVLPLQRSISDRGNAKDLIEW
jgi:hypothetical protein